MGCALKYIATFCCAQGRRSPGLREIPMADSDDEKPRPAQGYAIGQPLEALSVAELDARVEELRQEIARLEAVRARKQAAQAAAEAVFRR